MTLLRRYDLKDQHYQDGVKEYALSPYPAAPTMLHPRHCLGISAIVVVIATVFFAISSTLRGLKDEPPDHDGKDSLRRY